MLDSSVLDSSVLDSCILDSIECGVNSLSQPASGLGVGITPTLCCNSAARDAVKIALRPLQPFTRPLRWFLDHVALEQPEGTFDIRGLMDMSLCNMYI